MRAIACSINCLQDGDGMLPVCYRQMKKLLRSGRKVRGEQGRASSMVSREWVIYSKPLFRFLESTQYIELFS
jgi:hypothetical protein